MSFMLEVVLPVGILTWLVWRGLWSLVRHLDPDAPEFKDEQ